MVCEVFPNPSRMARLLAAFYTYIDIGEKGLWQLLRPCIHCGVLAPTREQCLRYADWLYVWGKDRVLVSNRMAKLVDDFHAMLEDFSGHPKASCRNSIHTLYDVFEPTLISSGLEVSNFGSLIFGNEAWLSMGHKKSSVDLPRSTENTISLKRNPNLHPLLQPSYPCKRRAQDVPP
ncbi:hypothetical protein C8J57DRAFT_1330544 [Mycena rebaudengoi]|nr:hypothetical protein C8J57DRAFT_1330544 [Mycena rebaudengoi]